MPQLIVTVKRLNKRRLVPIDFSDTTGIIGEVRQGFRFEGTEAGITEVPNRGLGKWYKDRDGHYYWGGGLVLVGTAGNLLVVESREITTAAKTTFQWFKDLKVEELWSKFNEQGENVTIAVLDTGYDTTNSELSFGITGVNVFDGSPHIQFNDIKSPLVNDTTKGGHGTFCAAVLAARNNRSLNLGIAPKSKLLVGKISSTGGLDPLGMDVIIEGISWAVNSGAEIISISFGKFRNEMPGDETYLQGIQNKLNDIIRNKKVLIFASSGDNPPGDVLEKERYPASLDGCVSVGASNNGLLSVVTVLSNRTIIHAQGVDVESYVLGNLIGKKTGTSMSVPIVAGIASLAVSFLKKKNNGDWDPSDLLKKMYDTAVPINSGNKKLINPMALFQKL